jgi:predicted transcriptional regulator of viral defense system
MDKKIIELFKQKKGYLQSKQLSNRAMQYQLRAMVENGEVDMLKRGLYRYNSMVSSNDWVEASLMVANGVLCLFSAWQYYELSTTIAPFYHLAIPNKTKLKLPAYPPIKLYYWSDKYFNLGKTEQIIDGEKIAIYALEKSVCDAAKYRNKIGMDIFTEVLKSYLSREDRNIDLLMKYASEMRVKRVITPYLQSLL